MPLLPSLDAAAEPPEASDERDAALQAKTWADPSPGLQALWRPRAKMEPGGGQHPHRPGGGDGSQLPAEVSSTLYPNSLHRALSPNLTLIP